jgi:hypothetical protein
VPLPLLVIRLRPTSRNSTPNNPMTPEVMMLAVAGLLLFAAFGGNIHGRGQ